MHPRLPMDDDAKYRPDVESGLVVGTLRLDVGRKTPSQSELVIDTDVLDIPVGPAWRSKTRLAVPGPAQRFDDAFDSAKRVDDAMTERSLDGLQVVAFVENARSGVYGSAIAARVLLINQL